MSVNLTAGSVVVVSGQIVTGTLGLTVAIATSSGCTGITWTALDGTVYNSTFGAEAHFIGTGGSGACTYVLSDGGTSVNWGTAAAEIKGSSTNTVDGTAHGMATAAGANPRSSPTETTTLSNDLVVSDFGDVAGAAGTWTAGTGTLAVQNTTFDIAIQYQTQASAAAVTPQANYSAGGAIVAGTICIKP